MRWLRLTAEANVHAERTARLFEAAGRHFNRGQRAIFFALGHLGWFIGPVALMVATAAVVVTMWRRQFASAELRAVESKSHAARGPVRSIPGSASPP